MTFETTRSEMAVGSNLLESGEMMLARMVEERDNDKLELFLQEMENFDNFLDEAESLLKSGQDDKFPWMMKMLIWQICSKLVTET